MHLFHRAVTSLSHLTHHLRSSYEQHCSQSMISNPRSMGNEPDITYCTFIYTDFYFFNVTWDQSGMFPLKAAETVILLHTLPIVCIYFTIYLLWKPGHIFQGNLLIIQIHSKGRVYLKWFSDCTKRSLFLWVPLSTFLIYQAWKYFLLVTIYKINISEHLLLQWKTVFLYIFFKPL